MIHPNFYQDIIGGQSVWRCCQCEHDTFSFKRAGEHQQFAHKPIELPESTIELSSWLRAHSELALLKDKRIVIGLLTWNTARASAFAAYSIVSELTFLTGLGIDASYCWVDNGSTDSTISTVGRVLDGRYGLNVAWDSNRGQSIARNVIIDYALEKNADYLLLLDGDIQLIPYSSYALARWLYGNDGYGCVGLYARNCTGTIGEAQECRSLDGLVTSLPHMAWTQYGAFDCKVLRSGVRFDEAPVFQGPGWGYEDDDLGLQMMSKGLKTANSIYFRYLHRNLHSGLIQLEPSLAAKVWLNRKSYVYEKWRCNPITAEYATRMRNQTMPRLT